MQNKITRKAENNLVFMQKKLTFVEYSFSLNY
jgi:hypothetical protein